MSSPLISLLKVLRVKQWSKNAFIFFPLIFSGNLLYTVYIQQSLKTFLGFCCIASSMYILNDLLDLKHDRIHPKKSKRTDTRIYESKPLVSFLILSLLAVGAFILSYVNPALLMVGSAYVLLHVIYNLIAKHVVILDVIFIALGFHLRILAGSLAIDVVPSVWLQLCVFILALFLGFTKRRHEMHILKEKANEHRLVLSHYTSYLLDQLILVCSTLAIVFYGLYTISPEIVSRLGHYGMSYSVVFVVYGIFRYLYLIHVKKMGDDPGEVLFSDWPMLVCIILWIAYVGAIIYF